MELQAYGGMPRFQAREILARNKDFVLVNWIKAKPTYLGDMMPITGDGRLTRD
jgi:SanA protein